MNYKIALLVGILSVFVSSCSKSKYDKVLIETNYGNIKIQLYDDTPLHKLNFIKLAKEGFYNDQLFHRVIANFMIQAGDPESINAKKGTMLGRGDVGYTIPNEILPNHIHKKGALAAARLGDQINPKKESNGCQFYIVQGQKFTEEQLNMLEQRGRKIPFTEEQKTIYITEGGAPHLDNEYTVFGEVLEGLSVIEEISKVPTDQYDRPIEDIIIKISLVK